MTRALLEIAEYFETINEENASKMELPDLNICSQSHVLSWDSVLMGIQYKQSTGRVPKLNRVVCSFLSPGWGHIHTADKSFHALPVEYFTLNYNVSMINFYIYRFSFIILEKENCQHRKCCMVFGGFP